MFREKGSTLIWLSWVVCTLTITGFLSYKMFYQQADKSIFLPGDTSHGHHQIEMACDVCHTRSFSDKDDMQSSCVSCHAEELKSANDSHPKSKFTDPRNIDRIQALDARYCVTCHVEHRPEVTAKMGLTIAGDFCFHCHSDISQERETHQGMGFDTCANAGCHNFHDNRALYEDFLLKHRDGLSFKNKDGSPSLPPRNIIDYIESEFSYPVDKYPVKALSVTDVDVVAEHHSEDILSEWLASSHARAGVNCSACHTQQAQWSDKVSHQVCETCHSHEVKGFLSGKHGMRLAQNISPMSTDMARASMSKAGPHKTLGCASCHAPHSSDTKHAAVEACLSCHDDEHSNAYKESKHYLAWVMETSGQSTEGTGVSCASCHLPRIELHTDSVQRIMVQHNQNDNLRPNEKMIRPVCMSCHSLAFSIDALADESLIKSNFNGLPSTHVQSIDLAVKNYLRDKERRN